MQLEADLLFHVYAFVGPELAFGVRSPRDGP